VQISHGIANKVLQMIGDEEFVSPQNGIVLLSNVRGILKYSPEQCSLSVLTSFLVDYLQLCAIDDGAKYLFSDETLATLQSHLRASSVIKFRILDIISRVATKSSALFAQCDQRGFLKLIIQEIDTDDLLEKLNVVELLGAVRKA
jgi:hypothetical protein